MLVAIPGWCATLLGRRRLQPGGPLYNAGNRHDFRGHTAPPPSSASSRRPRVHQPPPSRPSNGAAAAGEARLRQRHCRRVTNVSSNNFQRRLPGRDARFRWHVTSARNRVQPVTPAHRAPHNFRRLGELQLRYGHLNADLQLHHRYGKNAAEPRLLGDQLARALGGGFVEDAATNNTTLTPSRRRRRLEHRGPEGGPVDTGNSTASVAGRCSWGERGQSHSQLAGYRAAGGSSSGLDGPSAIPDGSGNYWGGATFRRVAIFYGGGGSATAPGRTPPPLSPARQAYTTAPPTGRQHGHRHPDYSSRQRGPTATNAAPRRPTAPTRPELIPVTVTFSEKRHRQAYHRAELRWFRDIQLRQRQRHTDLQLHVRRGRNRPTSTTGHELARSQRRNDQGRGDEQRDADPPAVGGASSIGGQRQSSSTPTTRPRLSPRRQSTAVPTTRQPPGNIAGSSGGDRRLELGLDRPGRDPGQRGHWGGAVQPGRDLLQRPGGTTPPGPLHRNPRRPAPTATPTRSPPAPPTRQATPAPRHGPRLDTTSPTVTNVSSSTADGAYRSGQAARSRSPSASSSI